MYFGKPYTYPESLRPEDVIPVSTTTSLTFNSNRKVVMLNPPANYAVSLPPVSSVELGTTVQFIHNGSTGTVTLLVSGSDVINLFGAAAGSLSINPGDVLILESLNTLGTQWGIVGSNKVYTLPVGTSDNSPASTQFVVAESNRHTNPMINSGLQVWQRGTSFSLSSTSSAAPAYTADMFSVHTGPGGASTVSRSALTSISGNQPFYALNINQTTGALSPFLSYKFEGAETFADRTLTISFYATAVTSGITLPNVSLIQNFGTGGSPSTVVSTTIGTNVSVSTTRNRVSLTIANPSISGKTFGTDGNSYLELRITLPSSQTFNVSFDNFRVDYGNSAGSLELKNYASELALCSRYFEPFQLSGMHGVSYFSTTEAYLSRIYFTVRKRTINSVVTVATSGAGTFNNSGTSSSLTAMTIADVNAIAVTPRVTFTNSGFATTAASYVSLGTPYTLFVDSSL